MITRVGTTAELADIVVDETIDASGHVVMPGLVNTHHHMYQNLTRVMVQDEPLFTWLTTLYPIWARFDDAAIDISARIAMAELLASGCTTSSDHLYILPNDCTLDTTIRAAGADGPAVSCGAGRDVPRRVEGRPAAGFMRGGRSPHPARCGAAHPCPSRQSIVIRCAASCWHPVRRFPYTPELMRDTADLARSHRGVRLHSHIAEVLDEEEYARDIYGCRSVEFAERVGWLADDVWFAHAIFLDDSEITRFAQSGTGATYCPSAHMRCGLGIMRAREMLDAGVTVGTGRRWARPPTTRPTCFSKPAPACCSSASHRNATFRQAPGGRGGFGGTPGRFRLARRSGWRPAAARALLGRDDIGALAPGMSGDVIAVNVEGLGLSGTQADPIAALVLCGPFTADHVIVNGVRIIDDGNFTRFDVPVALEQHRDAMRRFASV